MIALTRMRNVAKATDCLSFIVMKTKSDVNVQHWWHAKPLGILTWRLRKMHAVISAYMFN